MADLGLFGPQIGIKIHFKSYPNPDMNTIWLQKVPVGVRESFQGPKMAPKRDPQGPNGPQVGTKNMTQGSPLRYLLKGVGGMSEATK